MSNATDNFDAKAEALWNDFKQSVRNARTERSNVDTKQDLPFMERTIFGGAVRVPTADIDGTSIHITRGNWSGCVGVDAKDLRTIAAHCLAAAEEIEEAKAEAVAVSPTISAQRA